MPIRKCIFSEGIKLLLLADGFLEPLADLGGVHPARAPHLPGILVFDDILGHIV